MPWSAAGVVDSPRPLEAVTPQPLCTLDGWQYHLPLSYHDGRHDVHSTCPDSLLLQRWYDSQYSHYEHILCQLLKRYPCFFPFSLSSSPSHLFSSVPQATGGPGLITESGVRLG